MPKRKQEDYLGNTKFIKLRENLSFEYFGDTCTECPAEILSSSQGLLLDAAIVCHVLKELPAKPVLYFENYGHSPVSNGWIFVNLDCTNFDKLMLSSSSPNTILVKTQNTLDYIKSNYPFSEKKIHFTGFTSIDRYMPSIAKNYKKFIHIAGSSPYKGTQHVINIWRLNPTWPSITLVIREHMLRKLKNYTNIANLTIIAKFLPEKELTEVMNEHGIHICVSENEGFGHYINEARSTEAVIVYTDAPCMNEQFINNENGFGVSANHVSYTENYACPVYSFIDKDFENVIQKILGMSDESLKVIGQKARATYLENQTRFKDTFFKLIKGSQKIPHIIHHIWIDKKQPLQNIPMPNKYQKYIDSWKQYNPDFTFMFWTGDKIYDLIKTHYPQMIELYESITPTISKCDFARFLVVYHFGGFYVDLDFYCRKNIAPLLECESYFLSEPKANHPKDKYLICNGLFAACKLNEFVGGWIKTMCEKNVNDGDVLKKYGPFGLTDYFKSAPFTALLGNTCDFFPMTAFDMCLSEECVNNTSPYGVTLWSDGSDWGDTKWNLKDIPALPSVDINDIQDKSEIHMKENAIALAASLKGKKDVTITVPKEDFYPEIYKQCLIHNITNIKPI